MLFWQEAFWLEALLLVDANNAASLGEGMAFLALLPPGDSALALDLPGRPPIPISAPLS
jgi:hypothetical protein